MTDIGRVLRREHFIFASTVTAFDRLLSVKQEVM